MIVNCPSCGKRYKIADKALGRGRKVRCAACEHRWFVSPENEPDANPKVAPLGEKPDPGTDQTRKSEPPTSESKPIEKDNSRERTATSVAKPNETREHLKAISDGPGENDAPIPKTPVVRDKRTSGFSVGMMGWLLVTLLILALAGLVLGRNEVVSAFPQTAQYFRMIGLPVTVDIGLRFDALTSRRDLDGELATIVISGDIYNSTDNGREVPAIRVALLDADREEIDFGLFDPPQSSLTPGARMRFEARLVDPPDNARNYAVTFEETP